VAKPIDELKELQASVDRLELQAHEGLRDLAANAEQREILLLDETATSEAFSMLNGGRDLAQGKIERAKRLLPDLKKRLEALHTEERKRFKSSSLEKKIALAQKIKINVLELVGLSQQAQALDEEERQKLGAACNASVIFSNPATAAGLQTWNAFVERELLHKGTAYVEPPKPAKPAPKVAPAPDAGGFLKVLLTARNGSNQPGDILKLPVGAATALVEKGNAEWERIL
jgi:hypothetical protein